MIVLPKILTRDAAIKLGVSLNIPKNQVNIYLNYKTVPKDFYGWVDATLYLPSLFDVCDLVICEMKKRTGWWTGSGWYGCHLKDNEKVLKWRKKEGVY